MAVRRRRGLLFISAAVACVGCAMALQGGLNANFMAEVIKVSGLQMGLIESVRETCGITALVVIALLAGFAEPVVGFFMLILLAMGLAGYAVAPTYLWVMGMSLVWSLGLHVWMPLPNSMVLALSEPGKSGFRLGQIGAAGSVGVTIGLVLAFILTRLGVPMRPLFYVAGGVSILAGLACLGIPRDIRTPGPRLVFRKKYRLYYAMCFLEGWRKQTFLCFAGFLLVKKYGMPLEIMLLLQGIVQVIGYFSSPRVGRLIDRVGERKILITYFIFLTLFFMGYAFIHQKVVLCILFVLDSAWFVMGMALTTYVKKLVPPEERTPTLSMGIAMNHAAAVTMPLLGGLLWEKLGYQWVFGIGSLAAFLSIAVACRLPRKTQEVGLVGHV